MSEPAAAIWDFWAPRYDRLWSQTRTVGPASRLLIERVAEAGPPPGRVLDLGCGVGQVSEALALAFPGARVLAVDPAPAMVARARARNRAPNLVVEPGTAASVRGPYDLVVATHVLPYLTDPAATLRRVRGLLRPGGRLLLLQAHDHGLLDRAWLGWIGWCAGRGRYLSTAAVQGLLGECGFHLGVVRPVDLPGWLPSVYLVEGSVPLRAGLRAG